jgi:hypothetical protein
LRYTALLRRLYRWDAEIPDSGSYSSFAEYPELAARNASRRQPGQILAGGIGCRQQHNVLALVSDSKVGPCRRPA